MKITRLIAIAVIAASSSLGYVQAKTLANSDQPAEFPPSSFTGRQYVDSKGCVYIRAGIDGTVTWVPRVSRKRTVLCGFTPTYAKAPAPEPAPVAAPAARPAKVTAAAPVPKPAAKPAAKQATRPVTARAPIAAPRATTQYSARPMETTPLAAPVRRAPAAPVAVRRAAVPVAPVAKAPVRTVRTVTTVRTAPVAACPGGSAISSQYIGGPGKGVRCGPQTEPHVTIRSGSGIRTVTPVLAPAPAQVYTVPSYHHAAPRDPMMIYPAPIYGGAGYRNAHRVAPRHVYENQLNSTDGVYIPEGYKPVWTDDRLNAHRAHQTFAGKAQMDLVWTRTIPRKLINRASGRVVTAQYPDLIYPYTSYDQQSDAMRHQPASYRRAVISSKGQAPAVQERAVRAQPVVASTPTAAPASHRFVQAGAYASRAQAEAAAQRVARSGVPTRMGSLTKGDQSYSLVLAGPFSRQGDLNSALSTLRAMGFGNAVLRK